MTVVQHALFVAGRGLVCFSLFVLRDFLVSQDIPVVIYLLFAIPVAAAWFMVAHMRRPGTSKRSAKQGSILLVNGVLLSSSMLLFISGIRKAGPVRALLLDAMDLMPTIPKNSNAGKALLMFALGFCLLCVNGNEEAEMGSYDPFVGTCSVLLGLLTDRLQRRHARIDTNKMGGYYRLQGMSLLSCLWCITPLLVYAYWQQGSPEQDGLLKSPWWFPLSWRGIFVLLFTAPFYIVLRSLLYRQRERTIAQGKPQNRILLFVGIVAFLFIIDALWGGRWMTKWMFFAVIFLGFGLHLSQNKEDQHGFPDMNRAYNSRFSRLSEHVRKIIKHIFSHSDSSRIFIFLCINLAFMFIELLYGVWTNSLGLISDAGHMLFDCCALGIGLYASYVSKIKPNEVFTYGFGRVEVLSGFVNGIFLLFIGVFVMIESIERLFETPEIENTQALLVVSVLGLIVNLIGLTFFHGHAHGGHGHSHGGGSCCDGHGTNQNVRGIFLHILADTLGSVGVIGSSLLIKYFNWHLADPLCSMMISVLIMGSVVPLVQDCSKILLQMQPAHSEHAIRKVLQLASEIEGVVSYSNPHFWDFCPGHTVGSFVLHCTPSVDHAVVLHKAKQLFSDHHVNLKDLCVEIRKDGGAHVYA